MGEDVCKVFNRNEGAILGTLHIDNAERGRGVFAERNERSGSGHKCGRCGIGFWSKLYGRVVCPGCGYSFNVKWR